MSFPISTLLRRALIADAAITGATALLMIAAAGFLEGLLDLPATLLRYAGIGLMPFVAYLLYLTSRSRVSAGKVWLVITLNAAWVVGSALLLLSSQIQPNALGYAFVIVQALAVAGFAEMQYAGLRRSVTRAEKHVDSRPANSSI